MLNQIQQLQRQCADWEGCSTTAAGDKQKIISGLSQQIQTLQSRVDRVQTTTSLNTLDSTRSDQYALQNELRNAQSIKSSLTDNRPVAGAISGSIINLSV